MSRAPDESKPAEPVRTPDVPVVLERRSRGWLHVVGTVAVALVLLLAGLLEPGSAPVERSRTGTGVVVSVDDPTPPPPPPTVSEHAETEPLRRRRCGVALDEAEPEEPPPRRRRCGWRDVP